MSLNKEMIFGLAFGDDNMIPVPNKNPLYTKRKQYSLYS